MRRLRAASIVATGLAASLVLAACGGGGGSDAGGGEAGGTFSININSDPEKPLVPGDSTESEGGQVVDPLFTGLIEYNTETVEIDYTGVAESIETEDNVNFTVALKDGWTFHDGTPVTAQSFVDAWNYTANVENAQGGGYFFEKVAGYDADNPKPAMEGLVVVDDLNFTIELSAPFSQFPLMTGYAAFSPLPQVFYEDPEAFGRQPVGNGPFRADTEYVQGQGITYSRFEEYAGENAAAAGGVEIRLISDINTAYNELIGGNLDVLRYELPPELSTIAPGELGDRYFERQASSFTYVAFPLYDPRFQDPRVRQAFSMAVDRPEITEAIFSGTVAPAYDVIPPTIDGHRPDACQFCQFDPAAAQALLAETGFDTSQPMDLWFNAGAGHDDWVQAVGNQLQENLGITYSLRGDLDFAQYLPLADEQGMTGPYRLGWSMDYPSPENFLGPLFSTGAQPPAGSNSPLYSNPDFDRLLAEGNAAASNEEAVALYQQADDVLLNDMPVMPIFFDFSQGGHSERVDNVGFSPFATSVVLHDVTVTD